MRILLTNDDGLHAPGLWYAADALKDLGEVIVAAPDREQSGIGMAVTLHHPIRVTEIPPYIPGIAAYAVEGTPSDAVILALGSLIEGDVDLVVSGINQGANLGRDVLISGTVAAALQAHFRGINAIAISVAALTEVPYQPAALLLTTLVPSLMEASLPRPFLLNINLPKKPLEEIEGTAVTEMAGTVYEDQVQEADDVRRPYYWISRSRPNPEAVEGTDMAAIRNNQISIAPLQIGLFTDGYAPQMQQVTGDLLEALKAQDARPATAVPPVQGVTEEPFWVQSRARNIRPVRSALPRLVCDDLESTIAFYEGLGFSVDQEYKDEEDQRWEVTLRRGGAVVRCVQVEKYPPDLAQAFKEKPRGVGVDVYIVTLNVERVYDELKGQGVSFQQEMETTYSGAKEFAILDPNGYRLVFGQPRIAS